MSVVRAVAHLGKVVTARLRHPPFEHFVSLVCIVVILVIGVPLAIMMLRLFLDDGYLSAASALSLPELPRTVLNTVIVIGASTVAAVIVASVLAWLNERTNARMGWATDVLPVVPMLVPSIAGAIGWVLLAAPNAGFINVAARTVGGWLGFEPPVFNIFSWHGLIFVYTLYLLPQVYLTVSTALRNVDPAIEEAARVTGSGPLRVLLTVTLPAVRPALMSGALLALVYGVALFSVPLIIGTQANVNVLTVEVVRLLSFTFPPRLGEATTLSMLLGLVLAVLWWINGRLARAGNYATIGGKGSARRPAVLARPVRVLARTAILLYLLTSSVLPLCALIIVSFQGFWSGKLFTAFTLDNYRDVFRRGTQTAEGLTNSFLLAIVTATVAMGLAILLAHRIGDIRTRLFARSADAMTKVPGALSHMVVAVALLAAFAGPPIGLSNTLQLLVLAYVVLYLPQATLSAQSANQLVSRELSEASRLAGRGPGYTLARIVIPLTRGGIVAGWVFVFVLVVGDITASAILASPRTPVVGFVIMTIFQNGTYPLLAALGAVISVISITVVLTMLLTAGRRAAHQQ